MAVQTLLARRADRARAEARPFCHTLIIDALLVGSTDITHAVARPCRITLAVHVHLIGTTDLRLCATGKEHNEQYHRADN